MTYTNLVFQGLSRRSSQVILTFISLFATFLLLGLLLSLRQAFMADASVASSYRLRTHGASSQAVAFPVHYEKKVRDVRGVKGVVYVTAAPAAYQDYPQHLLLQAVSVNGFFKMFPELQVKHDQAVSFKKDKTALLAGQGAVDKYGWRLGQRIVLRTNVLKSDGTANWTFYLRGIYESEDPKIPTNLTFIHYNYLNDARVQGKDEAIGLIERIADPSQAADIAERIDKKFETSTPRLRTQPENEAVQKQLAQFGDFNNITLAIAGIVFLSMLLLSHNVWHERVQSRHHEFATMKVLGFRSRVIFLLVTGEALVLTLPAALAGLLASAYTVSVVKPVVNQIFSGFYFPPSVYFSGLVIAVIFAFIYSALPALSAAKASSSELSRA